MTALSPTSARISLWFSGFAKRAAWSGHGARQAFLRTAPVLLELLCVVLLAILAARLIWAIVLPAPVPDAQSMIAQAAIASPQFGVAQQRTSVLGTVDPFSRSASRVSTTTRAVPETTVNLKLFGMRGSETGGSAIIRLPDGKQRVFMVGEEIISNVRLQSVAVDHVKISRSGVTEALYLGDAPARTSSGMTPASASAQSAPKATSVTVGAVEGAIASLMEEVDLKPNRQGNRIDGFYVIAKGPSAALSLLGLRSGDLVRAVNGRRLISFERVSELTDEFAGEFSDGGALELEIERGGSPMTLKKDFGELK